MRKFTFKRGARHAKRCRPAAKLLFGCALPILLCLSFILDAIRQAAPLTSAEAVYYGKMLEFPLATLVLVTLSALLAELGLRQVKRKRR